MTRRYIYAGLLALAGVALAIVSITLPFAVGFGGLVVASASVPLAVLLVATGRLDHTVPFAALVAGGTLAIALSLIGYALLGAATYLIVGGSADWLIESGSQVLDADLMSVLRDPWMILFAIDIILLAPVVEEFAKAVSSRFSRPFDRKSALLTGVAAGIGFAIVENVAYATGGFYSSGGWETVILVRMLGSAVHPVAAGLVSLGWWEFRTSAGRGGALRLIGVGVGVHALWNGAVMAVFVSSTAFSGDATPLESVLVTVAYAGALGIIIAVGGWQALNRVANDELPAATADPTDARMMSAWVLIASTVLIPAVAVVFAMNGVG